MNGPDTRPVGLAHDATHVPARDVRARALPVWVLPTVTRSYTIYVNYDGDRVINVREAKMMVRYTKTGPLAWQWEVWSIRRTTTNVVLQGDRLNHGDAWAMWHARMLVRQCVVRLASIMRRESR